MCLSFKKADSIFCSIEIPYLICFYLAHEPMIFLKIDYEGVAKFMEYPKNCSIDRENHLNYYCCDNLTKVFLVHLLSLFCFIQACFFVLFFILFYFNQMSGKYGFGLNGSFSGNFCHFSIFTMEGYFSIFLSSFSLKFMVLQVIMLTQCQPSFSVFLFYYSLDWKRFRHPFVLHYRFAIIFC